MSRLDSLGLAKQAALGTMQTVMEYFPPVESVEPTDQSEALEAEETTGTRFPSRMDKGGKLFELAIKIPKLRISSAPRILSMFLGAPTTTTPEPGPAPNARQHMFDPSLAGKAPVPHSLLVNRTDPAPAITDLFWDAKGQELTLQVDANGYLNLEATVVALDLNEAQPEPTVTLDLSERFTFDQVKAYLSINGGAETEYNVSSFKLTYTNELDTDGAILGTRKQDGLPDGNASAEVEFTTREELATEYRRALKGAPDAVKIRLEALGTLYGGVTKAKCEVIVYLCEYLEAPAGIGAQALLSAIPIKARAALDPVSGKFVTVAIVNNVTTPY